MLLPLATELLFLFAVVWCLFWVLAATRSRVAFGVAAALGAVHWVLAEKGFYTNTTAFPPTQVLWLVPVVVALVVAVATKSGRAWFRGLDLLALTMLHILRVPVELTLHQAYVQDLVPQAMTYSGQNFDLFSGVSAAFMAAWMLNKRPPGRGVLLAWNLVCLGLLVNVVITAVLSIPSSVQRLNFDHPNVLVTSVPYVLLPALLVPAVLWAHVAALVRLWSKASTGHR